MDPITFRRHLHNHPELSFEESATAQFIKESLEAEGIECRIIAKTGVLARIKGVGDEKRCVVLRADIDALPICETTNLSYCSSNEGVMHACGHDMHAGVLFGVLQQLHANPTFEGTVFGLFQPGEEVNPGGAVAVLAEHPFDGYDVVAIVGEHVEPQLNVGILGFKAGQYMAANDELRFWVRGKGGHAALRSQITDTVSVASQLVLRLLEFNSERTILSIGKFRADGATNVIPSEVYLEGTLRNFDEPTRKDILQQINEIADSLGAATSTQIEVKITNGYPSVVNDAQLTQIASELAQQMFSAENLTLRATSEDFGHYTLHYPSLFYRLGVGRESGSLHTATFSPDEAAINVGQEFMEALARKILR